MTRITPTAETYTEFNWVYDYLVVQEENNDRKVEI